ERPPIPQIANELGVGTVMECSVAYGDGRIVISVQLIDGRSGVHIWSERYNRAFEDVFGIQADIAMNVANALAVEFSVEEQQAIETEPTDSPEAYALYLQALSLINFDNAAAMSLLERTLAFDPEFAAAHRVKASMHAAALINTTGLDAVGEAARGEQIALADFHAARALEYDPSLASQGPLISDFLTWRWNDSLAGLADVPDPLGQASIWLYSYAGLHDTAIARARRAVSLDPRNWNTMIALSTSLAYAGQLDEALRVHREIVAQAPAVPLLHSWLAYIEIARGNPAAAASELSLAEQLLGTNRSLVFLPELAYAYSRIGRRDDARRIVQEIAQSGGSSRIGSGGRAMVALAQGDRAAAIEQLEAALAKIANHEVDEGYFNLMNLRMNYMADPVLNEPVFADLRSRLHGD
ncbi:MAG: hypothetical protein PVF63_10300, partial [Gammaproteobacteria bacterium]